MHDQPVCWRSPGAGDAAHREAWSNGGSVPVSNISMQRDAAFVGSNTFARSTHSRITGGTMRRIMSALVSIAFTAATHSAALAQAPTVTNTSADSAIDGYAYNSCNNEFVHVTGTEHVDRRVMQQAGATKVSLLINFANTKGVGMTTGARYVLGAVQHEVDFADGPAFSTDYLLNEQLIGQGQASNLGLHLYQTFGWDGSHYTFTTNRYEASCN